jgi:DNA-binding CsgD family transcriptional regulator
MPADSDALGHARPARAMLPAVLQMPVPPRRALAAPQLTMDLLVTTLDLIDSGVMVLDAAGLVLLANDAARHELAEGGVLALDDEGQVDLCGGASLLALRTALQAAVVEGRRELLPLRVGEQLLTVSVQPLRSVGNGTAALLLMARRQVCPELVVEMLAKQHALTPAERRVLAGLAQGQRVTDLAKRHRVKVSTLRSQVASLRNKFGVRRIDDLTRLMAELPPMAPVLRTSSDRPKAPLPRNAASAG